jgi:hypothetical protein
LALWLGAAPASAVTLTFDDAISTFFDSLPDGYGGFHWLNMYAINGTEAPTQVGPSGYANGMVSPDYVAFVPDNGQGALIADAPFTLNSASFAGAWTNDLLVTVTGYDSAFNPVQVKSFTVGTQGPSFEQFDWHGLRAITIAGWGGVNAGYSGGGSIVVIDDLTVNAPAVPEPASWALMAGGFGLLGGLLRRTRRPGAQAA